MGSAYGITGPLKSGNSLLLSPYSLQSDSILYCDTLVLVSGESILVNIIEKQNDRLYYRLCGALIESRRIISLTIIDTIRLNNSVLQNKLRACDYLYLKNESRLAVEIVDIETDYIWYKNLETDERVSISTDKISMVFFRKKNEMYHLAKENSYDKIYTTNGDTLVANIIVTDNNYFLTFIQKNSPTGEQSILDRKFIKLIEINGFPDVVIREEEIAKKKNRIKKEGQNPSNRNGFIFGFIVGPIITGLTNIVFRGKKRNVITYLSLIIGMISAIALSAKKIAREYKVRTRFVAFLSFILFWTIFFLMFWDRK